MPRCDLEVAERGGVLQDLAEIWRCYNAGNVATIGVQSERGGLAGALRAVREMAGWNRAEQFQAGLG